MDQDRRASVPETWRQYTSPAVMTGSHTVSDVLRTLADRDHQGLNLPLRLKY
jgi:hypothetical protein